ncbi:MAG: ThiF family adenylyltransferase [Clostridia bacterium]
MENVFQNLANKKIAIIGLGGIGGYIASLVSRLNPSTLLLIDGDNFSQSNLNRQLFCTEKTIGKNKAYIAKEFLQDTTKAQLIVVEKFLTDENIEIIKDMDIIMDATDNVMVRLLISSACNKFNIPIIHGAINGYFGQVAILRPNSKLLESIYLEKKEVTVLNTLSYVPALIASFEVSEMVKFFTDSKPLQDNQLLVIDSLNNDIRVLNI